MPIKTLIQKSDPIIRMKMPSALETALKAKARESRRSAQNEVIKRLAATLDAQHGEALKKLQGRILPLLQTVYP